jgi:FAD dependent oxidoreductase TIGR03364
MTDHVDVAIVGAGIVGLAHALAASRRGKRVVVVERELRANGASIRNFGFVTVTGQEAGPCWQRAMRSREVWADIAPRAGIRVEQEGLVVVARRPEAAVVLDAFLDTEMGEDCTLHTGAEARRLYPWIKGDVDAALWSPHEMRVESRDAIPKLAAYLAGRGVEFRTGCAVAAVSDGVVATTRGAIHADAVIVSPGDDLATLFPDRLRFHNITRCKLHMLRVVDASVPRLPHAVMTDLSLTRYLGYAKLPEAAALRSVLKREQPDHLANGVHLIVVRSADGSLVVGDSHHYGHTPDPFQPRDVDDLILSEYAAVFGGLPGKTVERWIGTYASAPDRLVLIEPVAERVRLVVVTSGTGASTAFAIGEEVIGELFG